MDFSEYSQNDVIDYLYEEYELTLDQTKLTTIDFLNFYLNYLIQYHPLKEEMIRLKKVIGYLEKLGNLDKDLK